MKLPLPPPRTRRGVVSRLERFFDSEAHREFNEAIERFCVYYEIEVPKVEWYERLESPEDAGYCFENGKIHLIHPENWKKNRVYNTREQWITVALHELGHYLLWADAERKANLFAEQFQTAQERKSRKK